MTLEQVQQLATLHGRSIIQPDASPPDTQEVSIPSAPPLSTASSLPATKEQESDLMTKLSSLETTVAVLQQQVTQLALALQSATRAAL